MKLILILICIIIAFFIAKEKGEKRVKWLIIGLLFTLLDVNILSSPPISSHKLYLIAFYFSLYRHNEFFQQFRNYPFKRITLLLAVLSFGVAFVDSRLSLPSQVQRAFSNILELSSLFIGYCCVNSLAEYTSIYKKLYRYVILIGLFGILTWLIQRNPYYDFVTSLFNSNGIGIWSEVQERGYRVCSTFSNPIVYGFVMNALLLMLWEFNRTKKINVSFSVLLLLVVNILFANSRTCLVTSAISICLYFIFIYGVSRKLFAYALSIGCLLIVSYNFIPPITNILDSVLDIFLTGGANTKGTTLDLKEQQQAMAYVFFLQAPYFGNGYDYFAEVILAGKLFFYDGELAGLEGYGYKLLVEQGTFMIIANVIYMLCIFRFFIKRFSNRLSRLSFSLFLSFVVFVLTTGTYGGVIYYTFILLGMNVKMINSKIQLSNS